MSILRPQLDRWFGPSRANFACHLVEGVFASFGGGIVSGVVVQLLLTKLGYSAATLGFLGALGILTSLLQFGAAPAVEAAHRKKRLVLLLGIGQRLPHLMIAVGLLLFGAHQAAACLAVIVAARVVGGLSVSVLVAPWMDLVAETVPAKWTGRLFGWRNASAAALGIVAALLTALVLDRLAFPGSFALIYGLAFAFMVLSWLIFALVDEIPPAAQERTRQRRREYYRDLVGVLRTDARFRWYLGHRALYVLGLAGAGFYAMFAARNYGVSAAFAAGAFVVAGQTAAICGNLTLGPVADRVGPKRMIQLGCAMQAAAALAASRAESGYAFAGALFLTGLGGAAGSVSVMPFSMRLFPRGRRIGYSALSSLVMLPVGIAASAGVGVMVDRVHSLSFLICALLCLAAVVPLERCRLETQSEEQTCANATPARAPDAAT